MSLGSGEHKADSASTANTATSANEEHSRTDEHGALLRALTAIADVEDAFTTRFYELLFDDRPDIRPLFGAHSLSEQEEMMRETLSSLLALDSAQNWLDENLRVLGKSHAEYGVTEDMYASFTSVMLNCAREVLGNSLDAEAEAAFVLGVGEVCGIMIKGARPGENG